MIHLLEIRGVLPNENVSDPIVTRLRLNRIVLAPVFCLLSSHREFQGSAGRTRAVRTPDRKPAPEYGLSTAKKAGTHHRSILHDGERPHRTDFGGDHRTVRKRGGRAGTALPLS